MLKNLFQPLNKVVGPRLCLECCESDQDQSATQNPGSGEDAATPSTTDRKSCDQMISQLRRTLATPGTK